MLDKSFGVGSLIFGDDCKYKFCSCFLLVMRQAIARVDTQLMGSCPDHSEKSYQQGNGASQRRCPLSVVILKMEGSVSH